MPPRGCSERAQKSNCVRYDDKRGFKCRINKTGFQCLVKKKLFTYYIKRYERVSREESERAVLKKFEMFRSVSERFPPLKPLPAGFGSMEALEKISTLKELAEEQAVDAERIYWQCQGVDIQANHPDSIQVDEGSKADPGLEGIVDTSHLPDDFSLQNGVPGSVLSEGSPGVPPGVPLDLGGCPRNQLDNPEGRPPPSSSQYPNELNQSMSDIERRASRYPDILPELECVRQCFMFFIDKLNDREMNEVLRVDSRRSFSRRSLEDIPSQLPEGILAEDPRNQLSKASMDDVGYQASYSHANDFSQYIVKNVVTTMLDSEQDGLLRNRSISKALEVVPKFTGRLKTNVRDIRPQVLVDNMDGDLQYQSKPIMEGVSAQASDLQVSDLCGGGENFMIMPNFGGSNTSQIVANDCLDSWAEGQLNQFDMPPRESSPWRSHWSSPVRHVSDDTLPA